MSTLHLPHRPRDPFRPPEAPGLGRGMLFALLAHIVLVIAISANIQWRTKTLPTAEAELWSAVPHAAAPREQLPPPEPEPEPVKPVAKPDPTPPQPTPDEIKQQRDAEIAVAKAKEEKKRKEEEKRLAEQEEQKKLKALKEKQEKAEKAEKDKLDKQKADEKAKADKQKAEQEKAEKAKDAKAQKEADARREQQRQENLKRMMGMAGASGGENARGTQLKSSGPSSSYGGRVVARVRPNITYADNPPGNPAAEVEVRLAPDGSIIGRKLTKSSGLPEWDNAVLRAIDKTETLPRDTDGSVPSSIVISFKPKDL